jgi:hypothetical protein
MTISLKKITIMVFMVSIHCVILCSPIISSGTMGTMAYISKSVIAMKLTIILLKIISL